MEKETTHGMIVLFRFWWQFASYSKEVCCTWFLTCLLDILVCFHLLYHYSSMQVINCSILCVLITNHHHASLIFSYFFATLRLQETYNYRGILRLCQVHLPTLPSFHSVSARNSTEDAEVVPLTLRYSKSIQISYFLPLPSGILMKKGPQSSFSGLSTSI